MSVKEELALANRLKAEGFDLETCSTAEKVLYVWKLYLTSEDELKGVLDQLDMAKRQHAAEMQEIEAYVEQIKTLSDERESLTLEFEKENDVMKSQVEKERAEVADMLHQQDLEDVASSSVPEQIAFLLVERAKLLDALEHEVSLRLAEKTNPVSENGNALEHRCMETQTESLAETSGIVTSGQSLSDEVTEPDEVSVHSQTETWEECDKCRKLQRERNELSTKFIVADEQVKSLERRVARYKVLLSEDVVHKEDVIGGLHEELRSLKEQLAQKTEELSASATELSQAQTILNSANERYETYEQTCQPFDSTQTSFTATQTSFATTFGQLEEQLTEQLKEKTGEVESLQKELKDASENSVSELEHTILDYEQKLEALGERTSDEYGLTDLQDQLEALKSKLTLSETSSNERISLLEAEKLQLEATMKKQEDEIQTYQSEFEQILESQEEELDRNEQLQNELDKATSAIQELQKSSKDTDLRTVIGENTTLKEQYCTLEGQHTELLEKLSSLTSQYEAVMERLESVSTEYQTVKKLYQECKTECQKATNDYSALQQIHEILNEDVETLMNEKSSLSKSNSHLQQQIRDEEEFHAEELAVCDEKLLALKKEFSSLKDSHQKLEDDREALKSKLRTLDDQNKDLSAAQGEAQSLKSQILELEEDNFKLAESVRTLTTKVEMQCEEVVTAELETEEMRSELEVVSSRLRQKLANVEQEKLELGRKRIELIGDCDSLSSEHKILMSEHNDLDSTLSQLQREHKSLNEEYKELQMDYDTLNGQLQTLQVDHDKVSESNEELSAQCDKLKGRLSEAEEERRSLEEELEQLSQRIHLDQIDDKKKVSEELETAIQELQEARENLEKNEEQCDIHKMEFGSAIKDVEGRNVDLTERVLLLEKAAEQLEEDNKELAKNLQQALSACETNETSHRQEIQRLKTSSSRLQEQLERLKKYTETIEKELETLEEKLNSQPERMQDGSEVSDGEILSLRSDITQLKLDHSERVDSLELRLLKATSDSARFQDSLDTKTKELSDLQGNAINVQHQLDEETMNSKHLENRNSQLELEITANVDKLKEVNERKMQIEIENQKLAAELRESISSKNDSLLTSMHETDCNKALELAELRITSLETQRDELRTSVQQVSLELEHANMSITELSELRIDLQAKKNETTRLESKLKDEQSQRSYEDRKVEELKLSLASTNHREAALQEQSNEFRHKIIDLENTLSKLQADKYSIQHEMNTTDAKSKATAHKLSTLQAEKETLEVELMAANEKLQLNVRRYQERKTRHRNRVRSARMLHDTELAKLRDKMEYLDRDLVFLKQAFNEEQQLKLEAESKCATLVSNHRNLLSKQVDLEDEIRERNRGIALLQTKLQYIDQENKRLMELCDRLKVTPSHARDVLDLVSSRH